LATGTALTAAGVAAAMVAVGLLTRLAREPAP